MNTPFYIAKRYLYSKSNNNAINKITRIASLGVLIGTAALFVVLSGFAGLREFSLSFSSVFDSDLKISPVAGKLIRTSPKLLENLKEIEGVTHVAQVLEERVYLNFKGKNHIAVIKGVDSAFNRVIPTDSILLVNDWFTPGMDEAVIGLTASIKLSLGTYDYSDLLEIYVPKPGTGQILDPNQAFNKERVLVTGIYSVNEDLDDTYVFTDIALAQRLLGSADNAVSGFEIKTDPKVKPEELIPLIKAQFGDQVDVKTRIQQNDALYKMLNTENIAVYLIFTLVLIIALFNVIGAIIMMILDKKKNLKTLMSMGFTLRQIRKVFYYQGFLLTAISGLAGLALGYLLVFLQLEFGFVRISASFPYPVVPTVLNGLLVLVTILALGAIASAVASRRITTSLLQRH